MDEYFVLIMDSDKEKNDNFFFQFNENYISIDEISDKLEKHKQLCGNDNVEYNYVLVIRKLELLGLRQVNTYIKEM